MRSTLLVTSYKMPLKLLGPHQRNWPLCTLIVFVLSQFGHHTTTSNHVTSMYHHRCLQLRATDELHFPSLLILPSPFANNSSGNFMLFVASSSTALCNAAQCELYARLYVGSDISIMAQNILRASLPLPVILIQTDLLFMLLGPRQRNWPLFLLASPL